MRANGIAAISTSFVAFTDCGSLLIKYSVFDRLTAFDRSHNCHRNCHVSLGALKRRVIEMSGNGMFE